MRTCIVLILAVAMALAFQAMTLAAEESVMVSANVPTLSGLMEISISSIDPGADPDSPSDDTWTPQTDTSSIDFGTLTRDKDNKIFVGSNFFAVDVAVVDNTGRGWTLSHTTTPIAYQSEKLDDHINVAFSKVTPPLIKGGSDTDTPKDAYVYSESNNVQYNKDDLDGATGGWLRIYYGIATGGDGDAPNATPIPQYQLAGQYTGGVTITLTPQ